MNSAAGDRERLVALLAALDEPARAGSWSADDPRLVAVARHHRLTPLLSSVCGPALPGALADTFRQDRLVTAGRNMLLGRVAEECIRALDAAQIPSIVLKGLDYASRLYDVAGARPTADVDLLVPDRHRRAAFRLLDRLGFEPRAAAPGFDDADYHEVAWTRAEAEVDLHLALAPLARCRIDYDEIWRRAEPHRIGGTETRRLARPHAAIFQALHMAIDHFDVPAIYLLDLARLLPGPNELENAEELARSWHCHRPLATARALASALLPRWLTGPSPRPSGIARRVIAGFGAMGGLPRREQLLRKFLHFDTPGEGLRYLAVQSRRGLGELFERHVRRRTARERLRLGRTASTEEAVQVRQQT